MTAPGASVLAEFGADFPSLRPMRGGQGTTWTSDTLILKPTDDPVASTWIAEATASLGAPEYRVAQPVRGRSGSWVVDGWSAWRLVRGEHGSTGRWGEILPVARALQRDLAPLPRPTFLDGRHDAWALGDRVAWEECDYRPREATLALLISRCAVMQEREGLAAQVIHGDLYGNVLFRRGQPPAVIDLSPYWRPPEYALCVAAVDALAWYSAPAEIVQDLDGIPGLQSLLARAAMFRLVTSDCVASSRPREYADQTATEFQPVVDLIARLP